MKRLIIPVAAAALLSTALLPSCKKKDDSPSRAQLVVGTWKDTEEGVDSNKNGSWDASEHNTIAASDQFTLLFNSNGTGTISGTASGFPITGTTTWNLQNNDNDIRLITNILGTVDTTVETIVLLTSTDCILKDESDTLANYTLFKKQ
jgi:hypothetical protein